MAKLTKSTCLLLSANVGFLMSHWEILLVFKHHRKTSRPPFWCSDVIEYL